MSRSHRETVEHWFDAARGFDYLVELNAFVVEDDITERPTLAVRLVLSRSETAGGAPCLVVVCTDVGELHVESLCPGSPIGPLFVDDLRARGWDGPALKLSDREQDDKLRLTCAELTWELRETGR